jgi:arginase
VVTVVVPFHQDERLPSSDIPRPEGSAVVVAPELPDAGMWPRLTVLYEHVADAVATARGIGRPVVLSGDCLVATAVLTGLQRAALAPSIVWFDAHGDVHTLHTSTSGYPGGMALQLVMGAHPELLSGSLGLSPLTADQAVLVDARDLDPAEIDVLASGGPRRIAVNDVTHAQLPPGPLVLHVDVDVVDPDSMPGLRFPAPGGPSPTEVLSAAQRVMDTGRVVAVDISCPWLPTVEEADRENRARMVNALAALEPSIQA